jgi:trimeric autotransporter adhesin
VRSVGKRTLVEQAGGDVRSSPASVIGAEQSAIASGGRGATGERSSSAGLGGAVEPAGSAAESTPETAAAAEKMDRAVVNGGEIPYRTRMEQAFGADFGSARATVGASSALGERGAVGAARGEEIAVSSPAPASTEHAHTIASSPRQAPTASGPRSTATSSSSSSITTANANAADVPHPVSSAQEHGPASRTHVDSTTHDAAHLATVRSATPPPAIGPISDGIAGARNTESAGQVKAAVETERAKLTHAFATKREVLQSALGTQTAAMISAAATAHVSTIGALTEREQRVRAAFAGARANVRATLARQAALARSDAETARERLRVGSGSVVAQIHGAAQLEAQRMRAAADSAGSHVTASGTTLRAEISARPVGDLRSQIPDIEPDETRAVEAAIGEAKANAASLVLDSNRAGAEKLHATAVENGTAFTSNATNIADQTSAKLPEAEQSMHAGGEAVASVIEKMAGSQLSAIDVAERQVLAQLAEAKTHAANLLGGGRIAAGELRSRVGAQIAGLSAQETAAQKQLHDAGARAVAQLASHGEPSSSEARTFANRASASLQQGANGLIATLDHATAIDQLSGAGATFGAIVRERRDQMLAGIDTAIGTAGGVLELGLDELTTQCAKVRADASAAYSTAEAQLVANAQPGIQTAHESWKAKADEFIASAHAYESDSLTKHGQVRAELPAQMAQVMRGTVAYLRRSTARRVWDGVKSGLGSIAWGLVKFVGAVIAVTALLLVVFGTAFLGLAAAIAVLVVGAVMLAVGFLTSFINRLRMLWNNDWPWYAKIIGIPVTFGVAIGDVLGLSQIAEGVRRRELISDRVLSTEESAARFTEGAFQLITLGAIHKYTRGSAARGTRPNGELPAGLRRALPSGETTSATETAPAATATTPSITEITPATAPTPATPATSEIAPATQPTEPTPATDPRPTAEPTPAAQTTPGMEPASGREAASNWLARLKSRLTPEELAQYERMKGKWSTPDEMRRSCNDNLEYARELIARALQEKVDAQAVRTASGQAATRIRELIVSDRLLESPEALTALRQPVAIAVEQLRAIVVSAMSEAQNATRFPGSRILRDVKVWEQQTDMTPEQYKTSPAEAKQGLTVRTGPDGIQLVYRLLTDIDMLVLDDSGGAKARIRRMEQQKSGARDRPSDAKSQNDTALDALASASREEKSIRMETREKVDITDQIDLTSATADVARTIGPAGKGFNESLGITAADLARIIKEIVIEAKNAKQPDGAR